jgi:multidrug efflux pump subunit AcrA (membrane-fusion protein)
MKRAGVIAMGVTRAGLCLLTVLVVWLGSGISSAQSDKKPLRAPDGRVLRLVGKSTGQVEAFRRHGVTVRINGIVERIHFKPGQRMALGGR